MGHGTRDHSRKKERAKHGLARFLLGRRRTLAECGGVTLECRAKREAPAQAELRPTCAEASGGAGSWRQARTIAGKKNGDTGAQGSCSAASTLAECRGDVTLEGRAKREAPAQAELRPTCAEASGGAGSWRARP